MIWYIYIVSIAYCIWRMISGYNKKYGNSPIGPTPGLETLFILPFAPLLAVLDASLTWLRWYREAEEARRKNNNIF